MTPSIVEALEKIQSLQNPAEAGAQPHPRHESEAEKGKEDAGPDKQPGDGKKVEATDNGGQDDAKEGSAKKADDRENIEEPSLSSPKLGNPISHGQVIHLSRQSKARGLSPQSLDVLLGGARVYVRPPPPKPEPTYEYRALMARLRREEEARSYERMTNLTPPVETFTQRFPSSSAAHAFSNFQSTEPDPSDETTYADVDRQMALIFNVLISIVACAAAIWIAAKWWSTPTRLALSMSGSLLVGVAEVVVYSGYIRRVGEAKGKEKGVKEVKEVIRTWVVGGGEEEDTSDKFVLGKETEDPDNIQARRRKKDL